MKEEYIEKIYAGWLAKIIGIRLGAPVESWTYEKIKNIYGEIWDYPVNYREFAADDDSNGPLFFLRALEDGRHGFELTAQDVGEALLNYAPFEHGFFCWGGYGVFTEHTAYLNLRNGIPAPRSGSIEQNGKTLAEQIGGQIFIDTWGLVAPGNPDLAAKYAKEAASVTHDGNGVHGGVFIAVCISAAFEEKDIRKILETGLSYIPADCEYARVVRSVMDYHREHPVGWRECFRYIQKNFGYDRYPGNCHIIPNTAVIILSLLYGNGDFTDTLCICNMCGWDTDCNVGNAATIMGVRNGLEGIDYKWRKPINDLLICSSVMGSMNIMDIPYGAVYITKLAYAVAGEPVHKPWEEIIRKRIDSCHFEFPGSTHAMRVKVETMDPAKRADGKEWAIMNTDEAAYSGTRSLKVMAKPIEAGENVFVYKKTYYEPEDFNDNRYEPCFSPLVYPGQTLHGAAMIPEYGTDALVNLYVKDLHSGKIFYGQKISMTKGKWNNLEFQIPALEDVLLGEMGFCFHVKGKHPETCEFIGLIDDLYADGQPEYTIDFKNEKEEVWSGNHREVSQFTKLKGSMYLSDNELHLSCADFAEAYTGRYDWRDYEAVFYLTPLTGECHMINVRVQGAVRSYAFGFLPNGKAAILKNDNGYQTLKEMDCNWAAGKEYRVSITVNGNRIRAEFEGGCLEVTDDNRPYLTGSVGLSVRNGSHAKYRRIEVKA